MRKQLTAKAADNLALSPSVGVWSPAIKTDALIGEGVLIGHLRVLGRTIDIINGETTGVVSKVKPSGPVSFGQELLEVTPLEASVGASAAGGASSDIDIVMTSDFSGRLYLRPSPEDPPFVQVGDVISKGQTICLIEVMKTFTRVQYDGDQYPASAKIVKVFAEESSDIEEGAKLFGLEKA